MARNFVLGIDCVIYMQNSTNRATAPPTNPFADATNIGTYTEFATAQDVTLNLTAATADLTSRRSNSWRQVVSTLKEGSVDFSVLWEPDEPTGLFLDLLDAYLGQCPRAFLVLDGPSDGDFTGISRCTESGLVTGLYGDFIVTSFSRNEALEEGVTADVTIELGRGAIYPEWVRIDDTTPG